MAKRHILLASFRVSIVLQVYARGSLNLHWISEI